MNRYGILCRRFVSLGSAAMFFSLSGCDQLAHGNKIKPLQTSDFFADGQSSRIPPVHSVPLSGLRIDTLLYAGRNPDGTVASQFPWPINANVLARGQQQFLAICASCHGPDGYGDGIVVRRGFPHPPSYYEDRLMKAPVGHFFQVITHGYGAMYPYASVVDVNDRWAIVAYIRALQRSQHSTMADVPPEALASLQKEAK